MAQWRRSDWVLFSTILVMVCFGLVMVYSASSVMAELKYKWSAHFGIRQLAWAVVSFFFLMYIKRRDYRTFCRSEWAFISLGVVLAMLLAVYVLDPRTHRWFRIAGVGSVQPSEFAKPALILFLAYFLTRRTQAINTKYTILQGALALAVLAVTVVVADFGTTVVLVLTAGVVFYVAGLEWKYFAIALALGLLCAGVAVLSKPYRLLRIITYVDPNHVVLDYIDPNGTIQKYANESASSRDPDYQGRQGKIALGSGGTLGRGLMQGKQKWLFLPEGHTDFIFAVVGEELGFFGCSALLAGYLIILWRGFRLFWLAPDDFGRYLALGITASIVIQALMNMSVVIGIFPNTGIPLPMISSGGSSLLSTLLCLGMLLSVSEQS